MNFDDLKIMAENMADNTDRVDGDSDGDVYADAIMTLADSLPKNNINALSVELIEWQNEYNDNQEGVGQFANTGYENWEFILSEAILFKNYKLGEQTEMYMNVSTGQVDTKAGWDYEDENGATLNAVDLGEVVEVEQDEKGDWVEA